MINALSYQVQEEIIEILLIATPPQHSNAIDLRSRYANALPIPYSPLPIPDSPLPTPHSRNILKYVKKLKG
ncbi:MAG: hypothetical protein F6K50_16765 [Moorea sp. SIO3I7]|uniref:hypothetical protein n=1 Tax=unclassified Moorena TaxID=2683338 RepID=UPI0013C0C393|nr:MULTISPECIES: hypothetical protein [unclassified Moorena]NEN97122.1 hypothetical protein [Moorena sp. SIO3I7]NEO07963.1 hypothetical protein [Moorena sp. SIO3I8]NEO20130.1 hypothetical protein [Moorena sp. SIO4A5]NEQ57249.1 hypothetical protein [Moorena sp. SIO4A1]